MQTPADLPNASVSLAEARACDREVVPTLSVEGRRQREAEQGPGIVGLWFRRPPGGLPPER